MDAEHLLAKLRDHFWDSGFNLFLTIDPKQYQKKGNSYENLLAEARSIILIGFAGKDFWGIFQNYLGNNPEFRNSTSDLIDSYTKLKFTEAANILDSYGTKNRAVYPFGENALELNFIKLAELGGAGVPSLLGLLLHPIYGTWISLRGAIISDLELNTYDSPISNFAPCPTCVKPCINACPANTISESGWDWETCMKFRVEDNTCNALCASRLACPYGEDQHYPPDQIKYHHDFVLNNVKEYFSKKS